MRNKYCSCGKLSVWAYSAGGLEDMCDDCVHRGCSCNVIHLNDGEIPKGVENVDWVLIKDEQGEYPDYYETMVNGKLLPCCEWWRMSDSEVIHDILEDLLNENSLTIQQTVDNFTNLISQLSEEELLKIEKETIEITDEGAIAFQAYGINQLSAAIGDKNYFVIISNGKKITLSKKFSVSDGIKELKDSLHFL